MLTPHITYTERIESDWLKCPILFHKRHGFGHMLVLIGSTQVDDIRSTLLLSILSPDAMEYLVYVIEHHILRFIVPCYFLFGHTLLLVHLCIIYSPFICHGEINGREISAGVVRWVPERQ